MIKLYDNGVYLLNGTEIVEDAGNVQTPLTKEEAAKNTMAYGILKEHNTSSDMERLQIRFDKLTSHDITFVGIIQTARASGLEKFPMPYVLTNCHNSLCAVGGTINEDDHMFGLTCAKKYGGVYVPPHQAVIHQFAREMLAGGGKMILGSDSHTRYGALGTMAMGEGGPELVKQLLNQTYDIPMPGVVGVYLTGAPMKGVGPQDVALAIIKAVFANGYVNNKVMEFIGDGIKNLSADFRIGIDVMTTETTCLSSIWKTDEKIQEFYEIHGRSEDYAELNPGAVAYYDGMILVDLAKIKPMIAMPFHPSNAYTIEELNLGGGFGIRYVAQDDPKALESYMEAVSKVVLGFCETNSFPVPFICIEPGRSIVGDTGITLYTIGSVKTIPGYRTYVSIDGGMTDNPRYALYQSAYEAVVANKAAQQKDFTATIAGRCCESGDLIQENMQLQTPAVGDILAVLSTGAYNYSMASNYNRVPRLPVVMVRGGEDSLAVRRETYEDLVRNDV